MQPATCQSVKTMKVTVEKVLTEIREPSTKARPKTTSYPPLSKIGLPEFRTEGHPKLREMWNAAERFAADVNNRTPYWLSFLGTSGTGKTHLAKMLYKHFMGCSRFNLDYDPKVNKIVGNTGQFCDWRRLTADLRSGDYGLIEDLTGDWFVVLDDVGSSYDPNGFVASALDQVLNGRLRKWTVITCNYGLAEIAERMDTRIASRMIRDDSIVVECGDVPDYNAR